MNQYRRTTTDPRHALPIDHIIAANSPAAADAIARRRHVEMAGGVEADVIVAVPLIIAPHWRDLGGLNADMRDYRP